MCRRGRDIWNNSPTIKELAGATSLPWYLSLDTWTVAGISVMQILSIYLANTVCSTPVLFLTCPFQLASVIFQSCCKSPLKTNQHRLCWNHVHCHYDLLWTCLVNTSLARVHSKHHHKCGSVKTVPEGDRTTSKQLLPWGGGKKTT